MLLTKIIENSTSAIKKYRVAIESKQNAENYTNALLQLSKVTESIKSTLDCAEAMKESGIVNASLMEEDFRDNLLNCIDECGYGISEMKLTMDAVKLLESKGDAFADRIKIVWQDAAQKYSEGPKGYLSMIGGLSNDPKRAMKLANNINNALSGDPSVKAIKSLVSDVAEANQIAEQFSLNPKIELFLKKVSSQGATVSDLTPEVLTWLQEKKLTSKLKIRF